MCVLPVGACVRPVNIKMFEGGMRFTKFSFLENYYLGIPGMAFYSLLHDKTDDSAT
jgi:hypothetical protein